MAPNSSSSESKNGFLVLLINLDSRPDRLKDSFFEANRAQVNFSRISAVDYQSKELPTNLFLSGPALACLHSHLKCYEMLLESTCSHALILEDDFKVLATRKLAKALDSKTWVGFDLIQFGFLYMDIWHRADIWLKQLKDVFFNSIICVSGQSSWLGNLVNERFEIRKRLDVPKGYIIDDLRSGSHGYLISRRLAEQIIRMQDSIYLPIDGFLGTLQYTNKYKLIRTRKSLLGQRKSPSDIK
jgi:GR25 family glycosyltransferase involved in LPS biosynthesis